VELGRLMRVRWYGQSAFLLSGAGGSVLIDPFGDMSAAAARGLEWNYPAIDPVAAELLLVTHEHADHNAVEVAAGAPVVHRATAGRFDSPLGEVVGISSEHDEVAGTARGANTIFSFAFEGLRVCHLGDFGQRRLRPEQREAIGAVDLLFLPAGGGPTIGGEAAAELVQELRPRLVIPMHYRTERINFLDPPDAFLAALGARVVTVAGSESEVEPLLGTPEAPTVALLAPPGA
jgi:L-ascorbate metabolism protein UlaG (beta-lactamase superfamily)